MTESDPVLFDVRGRAGLVKLNRPKALNALTLDMVRRMTRQLRRWAKDASIRQVIVTAAGGKAFCAGGDIRALYDWGLSNDPRFLDFYREEYQLDTLIKRFPKPYIAVLDGIAMGGGVGISVHGSHRVATEVLQFAMPETGIGLFPDVGGTYFLPRCPGETGMYLGLTGERLGTADALYAGVATHYVPRNQMTRFLRDLSFATDVDACVNGFAENVGEGKLAVHRGSIDRTFSYNSVEEIFEALASETSDWAAQTLSILSRKSPTSLKITHRQILEGAGLRFEDCMRLEYRIVNRILTGHDFFEGTRAVVVDKDQSPKWNPDRLELVSGGMVAEYFQPLERELDLPEPS